MSAKVATTVVSTKGQVILPKAIRDAMQWQSGSRLTVEQTADGVLLRSESDLPSLAVEEVAGMFKWDGPPATLEDMDAAIAAEVIRRHERGRY
jgi:AbrB family looped-hinge helix DNA binding protein